MALLEGIRILDLSRLLPGPYCTMLLGDLGAEVVKIETPGIGDYMRMIPPFLEDSSTGETISTAFVMVNRNKKSVALNFRNARGKEVFKRLAKGADVILETFRPGAVDRWGIGYEAMQAINPSIVYCSLRGYGQTGPYRTRAGHDLNYLALTGILAANGAPGGPPIPPAVQVADLSGGMLAAVSILAALVGRSKTGEGQYLDVSLFESALSWAGTMIGATFAAGNKTGPGTMQLNGAMACYNVYETQDGEYLTLGAIEPHFWAAFCKAVERPDLDARAYDAQAIPDVAAIFKTRTRAEWLGMFDSIDACIEPVRDFEQIMEDPHLRHRGLIQQTAIPGDGAVPQVGSVFVFANRHATPPPALGQHTREVLQGIGMEDQELEDLEERGITKSQAAS
ncbi:MAG: CoA transferase [Chloroflexi bacterium]|nr:CoA transferase [Chloroflexota bacterium]